jgi:hypothetical protein
VGLAAALNKPVVLIAKKPDKDEDDPVPTDLRNMIAIYYDDLTPGPGSESGARARFVELLRHKIERTIAKLPKR